MHLASHFIKIPNILQLYVTFNDASSRSCKEIRFNISRFVCVLHMFRVVMFKGYELES